MARTYNESLAIFLAGPIEWWWDTEVEPDRFNSPAAQEYRAHRDRVRDLFVEHHFLVYSPHTAFKGDWNEKMQPVNDFVISKSDIFIDLSPDNVDGLVANGTQHEVALAYELGIPVFAIPPRATDLYIQTLISAIGSHKEHLLGRDTPTTVV